MKHEHDNKARQLTPEQKKAKLEKKLFASDNKQMYAAVFR
jgi:hypothetical protein